MIGVYIAFVIFSLIILMELVHNDINKESTIIYVGWMCALLIILIDLYGQPF